MSGGGTAMFRAVKYRLAITMSLLVTVSMAARAARMTPEDVLQKHLASIGTPDARAATKSRVVEASLAYKILQGGSGQLDGTGVIVSDGNKLQLMLKINALKYHGEKFVRDGRRTFVAGTYDDGSRSEFGEFLWAEDAALREGLLGGTWSTGWALLSSDAQKKLHPEGIKKVDGVDYYAVSYRPKKAGDLDIMLYFEPDTFRHVMTIYKATMHAGIQGRSADGMRATVSPAATADGVDMAASASSNVAAGADTGSARQQETRYRIIERFSDFKTADGLTLPAHYELRFEEELTSFTKIMDWNLSTTRLLSNVPVNAKNFEIH